MYSATWIACATMRVAAASVRVVIGRLWLRANKLVSVGGMALAGSDLRNDGILHLSWTLSLIAVSKYYDRSPGLMLIEFSSVAVAIIAAMPAKLNAICIASPSEICSNATWLANVKITPRQ